jgi:hypothetical protein
MDNKRAEVARLLNDLKEAKGNQEKLMAASALLADLGLIPNTPQMKLRWMNQ